MPQEPMPHEHEGGFSGWVNRWLIPYGPIARFLLIVIALGVFALVNRACELVRSP